jgi:hypothetical protein
MDSEIKDEGKFGSEAISKTMNYQKWVEENHLCHNIIEYLQFLILE